MWLYLTGSGEITAAELNALAAACYSPYKIRFMTALATTCELQKAEVFLYSAGDVLHGTHDEIAAGGTTTSYNVPASVAACIGWQIAPSYRGGHPRSYLAGIPSSGIASVNSFTSTYLTGLDSRATDFHAGLEAITGISSGISSVEHGVISFVRDKAWRTPPVFYRISGHTIDVRIDTQRRRLGRDL